jgi:hypothetical protein
MCEYNKFPCKLRILRLWCCQAYIFRPLLFSNLCISWKTFMSVQRIMLTKETIIHRLSFRISVSCMGDLMAVKICIAKVWEGQIFSLQSHTRCPAFKTQCYNFHIIFILSWCLQWQNKRNGLLLTSRWLYVYIPKNLTEKLFPSMTDWGKSNVLKNEYLSVF